MILNCRSRLIKNYLFKGFSIIEHNTKQLSLIPNDVKLRINLIDKLKTDYVMVKNEAISAVANTIKQFHIHENMHMIYKQDFYKTKESEIDDFYLVPVIEDLEHPALIEEWIQNIDAATYENNLHKDEKLPSIKEKIDHNYKTEFWPKSIMESLNWFPCLDIM